MSEETFLLIKGQPDQIAEGLKKFFNEHLKPRQPEPDLRSERLNRTQAAKLADMSLPTFRRRIKAGVFKVHGSGGKEFFLRSEIINALKNESE